MELVNLQALSLFFEIVFVIIKLIFTLLLEGLRCAGPQLI